MRTAPGAHSPCRTTRVGPTGLVERTTPRLRRWSSTRRPSWPISASCRAIPRRPTFPMSAVWLPAHLGRAALGPAEGPVHPASVHPASVHPALAHPVPVDGGQADGAAAAAADRLVAPKANLESAAGEAAGA